MAQIRGLLFVIAIKAQVGSWVCLLGWDGKLSEVLQDEKMKRERHWIKTK